MRPKRLLRIRRKSSKGNRAWSGNAVREEERCRLREKELREKDILIQDNLIRFSTFLQSQEQRRNKDKEAAKVEEAVSGVLWVDLWSENRREEKGDVAVGEHSAQPRASEAADWQENVEA